jgi:ABC-type sugar transport system permease subunit
MVPDPPAIVQTAIVVPTAAVTVMNAFTTKNHFSLCGLISRNGSWRLQNSRWLNNPELVMPALAGR